jgi:hypothetical protein
MTASRLVRVTILVALLFLVATRLFAGPITSVVTIKTAADTAALIPSGSGNFIAFDPGLANVQPNPCISNGNVTFWGAGSGQQGLYAVLFGMLVKPLKYALLRGTFRSRYNPTENGFAGVKASFPGKDMIKKYFKSDTKKT